MRRRSLNSLLLWSSPRRWHRKRIPLAYTSACVPRFFLDLIIFARELSLHEVFFIDDLALRHFEERVTEGVETLIGRDRPHDFCGNSDGASLIGRPIRDVTVRCFNENFVFVDGHDLGSLPRLVAGRNDDGEPFVDGRVHLALWGHCVTDRGRLLIGFLVRRRHRLIGRGDRLIVWQRGRLVQLFVVGIRCGRNELIVLRRAARPLKNRKYPAPPLGKSRNNTVVVLPPMASGRTRLRSLAVFLAGTFLVVFDPFHLAVACVVRLAAGGHHAYFVALLAANPLAASIIGDAEPGSHASQVTRIPMAFLRGAFLKL